MSSLAELWRKVMVSGVLYLYTLCLDGVNISIFAGSSIFSNFTMAGNFLPDRSGDAQLWRDIGAET